MRQKTVLWLLLAVLAGLAMGALKVRQDWLTRGIPRDLPQPFVGGGVQIGLNVALEQYDAQALAHQLAQIKALGVQHVKQSFYYSQDFDWETADRLVTVIAAQDLTLVPLLDGDPADGFAVVDTAVFAQFATQFASRYGDSIQHYIIWDEPNITSHWGGQPVNANEYAALLTAAAAAIRTADSDALIVAAPLAPTIETGPTNLSDIIYLRALYEASAASAFDIAAAKPYGFDFPPDDRDVAANKLNFSRAILLREEMVRQGDAHKALWAGNWGWNSLPTDWAGAASIWGEVTAQEQADWTAVAHNRAQQEWPWLGLMFLENWQPDAPIDDPRWGFSIAGGATAVALQTALQQNPALAQPGFHLAQANHPAQTYIGGWRFSPEFGADISQPAEGAANDQVSFTFWGTDVGLRVRRADFRARLYITVDGQAANALPRDENGSMLILTSPDPADDTITTEAIARNLTPGPHTVHIEAERGWDQWALNGFSVGYQPPNTGYRWAMIGLGLTVVFSLLMTTRAARRAKWGTWAQASRHRFLQLNQRGQLLLTAVLALIVALSGWFTWGNKRLVYTAVWGMVGNYWQRPLLPPSSTSRPPSSSTPWPSSSSFLLIYFRPVWGLGSDRLQLSPSTSPLSPKLSSTSTFRPLSFSHWSHSPLLCCVKLTMVRNKRGYTKKSTQRAVVIPKSAEESRRIQKAVEIPHSEDPVRNDNRPILGNFPSAISKLKTADYAVLTFIAIATLSLFFTERIDVASNEWRVVILEPAIFYCLFRAIRPSPKELWLIWDAFVLSGLLVAGYSLWQYAFARDTLITAEGGLLRLRSFYGSPNNVALYLGRVLPMVTAVTLFGYALPTTRRRAYALAIIPIALAFLLTFSKGGLFLGAPAALLFIFWRWQKQAGRRIWPWLIGFGVLGLIGLLHHSANPTISWAARSGGRYWCLQAQFMGSRLTNDRRAALAGRRVR